MYLKVVSVEHSPVFCSLLNSTEFPKGSGISKFNSSFVLDCNFVKEMKCFIHDAKERVVVEDVFDEQSQWEILKQEIRKFSIRYLKVIAKEKRKKEVELESKLKILDKSLSCDKDIEEYHKYKADLNESYDNIVEGVKIRSRCQWYKENEKSAKYFLNLEKKLTEKSIVGRLVIDNNDLVKNNDISNEIFSYFKSLCERTDQTDKLNHNTLLQSIPLPSVTNDHKVICDNDII